LDVACLELWWGTLSDEKKKDALKWAAGKVLGCMDTKAWWQSKTVWGVILTVVGMVLAHWHVSFITDDATSTTVDDFAGKVGELAGPALSLYGRLKANTTIGAQAKAA